MYVACKSDTMFLFFSEFLPSFFQLKSNALLTKTVLHGVQ